MTIGGRARSSSISVSRNTDVSKLVYIMMTMDCESAKVDVSDHGISMSSSGPADYKESERSIRGFVDAVGRAGYPVTLFLHPEVAIAHRNMLLGMQSNGVCLGLHLHPYKLADSSHSDDLGAYPENEQRVILREAITAWESALGQRPQYFRAGYFSANDATFRLLDKPGFRGGEASPIPAEYWVLTSARGMVLIPIRTGLTQLSDSSRETRISSKYPSR